MFVSYSVCFYGNGQLVWTPALGLYLCVCLWGCPRHVERRVTYHVRLLLNVELRNITSDCYLTSSYVIT